MTPFSRKTPRQRPSAIRGKKGSAAFSPTSIPGLQLWLDASNATSITQSGGKISQWNDLSGNSNNAAQATAASQPMYLASGGINGKGSVYTSPRDTFMSFAASPLAGSIAATIYFVTSNDNEMPGGGEFAPLNDFDSSGQLDYQPYLGTIYTSLASTSRYGPISYTAGSLITPNIYKVLSATGSWSLTQGTTLLSSNTTNTFATGTAPKLAQDATFTAGIGWAGKYAEIIMYKRLLTTAEQAQVYNYLKGKWGTP